MPTQPPTKKCKPIMHDTRNGMRCPVFALTDDGEALRLERFALNISVAQAARLCRWPVAYYERLESGAMEMETDAGWEWVQARLREAT